MIIGRDRYLMAQFGDGLQYCINNTLIILK